MRLQLERPLAVFDLETTGTSVFEDRIVEIAIVTLHPDGQRDRWMQRVNPGRTIPAQATAIHHISDDDVKDAPHFADIANEVIARLSNVDIGGFNLLRFDLPLLQKELKRVNLNLAPGSRFVVDSQVIFHLMEPRNLSAAVRYYCDKELEGAHGALADAEGTLDVLIAQIDRYNEAPKFVPNTVADLHRISSRQDDSFVDPEGKIVWFGDEAGLNFGKYKGRSLRALYKEAPEYFTWILRKDFSEEMKKIIQDASQGIFPIKTKK